VNKDISLLLITLRILAKKKAAREESRGKGSKYTKRHHLHFTKAIVCLHAHSHISLLILGVHLTIWVSRIIGANSISFPCKKTITIDTSKATRMIASFKGFYILRLSNQFLTASTNLFSGADVITERFL
jgi:hypothetical protein